LAIAAAAAGALWIIALSHPIPAYVRPAAPITSIQAVTLNSGQVFFGTLRDATPTAIVLADVYEGRTTIDPQTKERTIRLVARRTADWHGPVDMAIPLDKILFTESVGRDSQVATQIARVPPAK
jgi:hypothetical protein